MYCNANIVTSVWFEPVIKVLRLRQHLKKKFSSFHRSAGAFGLATTLVFFATVIGTAQLFSGLVPTQCFCRVNTSLVTLAIPKSTLGPTEETAACMPG